MKRNNPLPCPKCGEPVIMKLLEPKHKSTSVLAIRQGPLLAYFYICPKCKTKSVFDKDYVREIWKNKNSSVQTIPKL